MTNKCIIVDDEPLAIELIKTHLASFEDIEITATCSNAMEANKALRDNDINLIFLDIEMPKISGFDFLKSLKKSPKIIITTANRDYAIKSYDFDIVDYLLKPISFERFYQGVTKFYKTVKQLEIQKEDVEEKFEDKFIYVNEDKTIHKLFIENITYIESYREYIKIHTKTRAILTKIPISKIEQKLKDKGFIRIHKSFIISIKKISSFNARNIYVGDKEIPIGRTYKQSVMEILGFNKDVRF